MAGSNFSKKMCQELLLFEDYLLSCKPSVLNKDKILIERERAVDLVAVLREHHCADRTATDEGQDTVMMDLQTILSVDGDEHLRQSVSVEEASIAAAQVVEDAEAETRRMLEEARQRAQRILEEASSQAQNILDEAGRGAQTILDEANRKADKITADALERAKEKERQVDAILVEKINETQRQSRAIIAKAADSAAMEIENKEMQGLDLEIAAFQKADNIIEQVEKIYARQLEVIASDKSELTAIIRTLQSRRQQK